ncbi:MAG TPA: hypothetical protein VKR53_05645 [Puia sp.]|nr:hypothetical protein [Puia sp.]
MKRNLKWITAGMIAGAASGCLSAPLMAAPRASVCSIEKKAAFYPEKFSISVSQVSNTGKINLHIEKGSDIKLTVSLRDANGEIVSVFTISRKKTDFSKEYDFSQADVGTYHLVVSDGHQTVTKLIRYEEPQTVTIAKFVIS